MAGGRAARNAAHRPVIGPGVVFGNPHDEAGDTQTDDRAKPQPQPGYRDAGSHRQCIRKAEEQVDQQRDRPNRQDPGGEQPLVERPHNAVVGTEPDEERANHRSRDAHRADDQRQHQHLVAQRRRKKYRGEQHRRDDRHGVGFEQVRGHAGAIADIIADIVSDDGRVARIVLRDSRLHFADEVGADIGPLSEDAAAETRENRDQ